MASCFEQVFDEFKDVLSKKEVEEVTERVQNLYDRMIIKEKKTIQEFQESAFKRLEELTSVHLKERLRIAQDAMKHQQNVAQAERMFKAKDYFGALDSALSRTGRWVRTNVEASVVSKMTLFTQHFKSIMDTATPDKSWEAILKKGSMDREIAQEVFNLSNPKAAKPTGNAQAVAIAKGLHQFNKFSYMELHKAGFSLNEMEGFIVGLQWDGFAVRQRFKSGSEYAAYMVTKIDVAEYKAKMDLTTDKEVTESLSKLYDVLSEKDYASSFLPSEGTPADAAKLNSLNDRVSRGRVLPYKDAQAFMDVYEDFGAGTLLQGFYGSMKKNARIVGRSDVFGTSTSSGFKKFYDAVIRQAVSDGDEKAVARLKAREKEYEARYRHSAGFTQHVADSLTAKAITVASSVSNLALLGKAGVVAAITDPSFGWSLSGTISDDSIFSRFAAQLKTHAMIINPKYREKIANAMNIMVNDEIGELFREQLGMMPDLRPNQDNAAFLNMLNKVVDKYSEVTLLKGGAFAARTNNARIFSIAVAEGQDKVLTILSNYGIGKEDLSLLMAGKDSTLGFDAVTPEALYALDANTIKGIIGAKKKASIAIDVSKGGEVSLNKTEADWADVDYLKHRDDILNKYRQAVSDFAYTASPTPTKNMLYSIFGDGDPNTFMGSLGRLMGIFKSFQFAVYTNVQRAMYAKTNGASRTFMDGSLGGLIIATTAAGGAATLMYDILAGRTPRDPTRGAFVLEAMDRGGATGLLGSILMASYARGKQDPVSDLAGPVVGRMYPDLMDLYNKSKGFITEEKGDELQLKDVGEKALRWAPFSNVWFGEALIKAWFTDRLRESMNPKFKSNQRAQMKRMSGDLWKQEQIIKESPWE